MEIEINGIKYRPKQIDRPIMSRRMASIYAMLSLFGGLDMYSQKREPERPKVDIVKEYELIQQKKSSLSRSQRDWVVWRFNQTYELVPFQNMENNEE